MQSETAISRELMGKIVDEVFDGAIEDTSVIEEIYAVIKREEAALSKVPVPKPLDLKITQDWFEKRAALEADHEIGAGSRKLTACIDPTPDELAELFKIAHRIPDGWQLVPVAALSAADPVAWQPRYKQEVIDHLRTVSDNVSDYAMTVFQTKEQAEEYGHGGHQVRALYAAQPAPSAAVKALEWRDEPIPPSGETLASSVVGLYCIPHSGDRFYLRFRDTMTLGDYSTLDKAKSAAQSDYEARIRSALSAQVQDVATARDALQAIANLPTGFNIDVCRGREEAYRAIEMLFSTPPNVQVQEVAGDEEWQSVPKHPTGSMIEAVVSMVDDDAPHLFLLNLYRAMLAAAPAKQEGCE